MERDALLALLTTWLSEILDRPAPPLTDATHLVNDVGLDSIALAELAAKVRHRFKIKLRPADLVDDLRVGAVLDRVAAQLKSP